MLLVLQETQQIMQAEPSAAAARQRRQGAGDMALVQAGQAAEWRLAIWQLAWHCKVSWLGKARLRCSLVSCSCLGGWHSTTAWQGR